jgi:hypothetical protein
MQLLFYETGDSNISVLSWWTKAWIARQSDFLKGLREKPLSTKRLSVYIVEDVKEHFVDFKRCKKKWKVRDKDVSNFNESGF